MTNIATILVAASGGSATAAALELACRFGRRFSAHIEALHVKPDPFELVRYEAGIGAVLTDAFVQSFTADAEAVATEIRTAFIAALERHGIRLKPQAATAIPGAVGASAVWTVETGYGPALVARRARFFDLVVLGRSERVLGRAHSDTIEQTLLHSGRSVLLAPPEASVDAGDCVAIAWNGTPEAVRAMAGALPFLATARETMLISIGSHGESSAPNALDYLAWHDVRARRIHLPASSGIGPGRQLIAAASGEGADLLAMGAYGHLPGREFLFGGATREVLAAARLPLLLTH